MTLNLIHYPSIFLLNTYAYNRDNTNAKNKLTTIETTYFATAFLIRYDTQLITSHSFKYIKNELLPINCSKFNSICLYAMKIIIDKDTTNGNIILIYVSCSTNSNAIYKANAHIPTPLTLFPNKS